MMKACEKLRCVANVNGQCAAETCRGELRSTGRKCKNAEDAAKEYQMFEYLHYLVWKEQQEDEK